MHNPHKSPKVSVLTPAHNAGPHLEETIRSVLAQTFTDFEYVLCDDGSSDNSWEVMNSFNDPRLRILRNETNQGSPVTRNRLIDSAQGEFCAILDADDLMVPERLKTQVEFLEAHSGIDICGSAMMLIDNNGEAITRKGKPVIVYREVMDHDEIAVRSLFLCAVGQSSVMFRREKVNEHGIRYVVRKNGADDVGFYNEAIGHLKFANLAAPLTKYRTWDGNMTSRINDRQMNNALETFRNRYSKIGIKLSERELDILMKLHAAKPAKVDTADLYRFFRRLVQINKQRGLFNDKYLKKYLRMFHKHHYRVSRKEIDGGLNRIIYTYKTKFLFTRSIL